MEERFLVRGAVEDLPQKAHRARRVCERRETGRVQGRKENSRREPHGFRDVVVLHPSLAFEVIVLAKDHDQCRCGLQEFLAPVGLERRENAEPLLRHPPRVVQLLFLLGGFPDLPFRLGIANDDELPRLHVGPRGRRCRAADRHFEHVVRNLVGRELADRSPSARDLVERREVDAHLLFRGPVIVERLTRMRGTRVVAHAALGSSGL